MQAKDVLDLLGSPEHKLTWLKQMHSRAYGCTYQAFVQATNVQHLLERQEQTSLGCNSHRRAYGCLVQARDVLDLLGSPEHKLTWLEQLHSIAYGCPYQAFVQDHRRAYRCLMQARDVLDLLGSPEHKLT